MQETGHPAGSARVDRLLQLPRVLEPDRAVCDVFVGAGGPFVGSAAEGAPVRVGTRHVPDAEPGRDRVPPGGVRRRAVRAPAPAVVRVPQREQVEVPREAPSQQDGQVVGLGARVGEVGDVKPRGELGGELCREEGDLGVEVDRGGVLEAVLFSPPPFFFTPIFFRFSAFTR